MPAIRTNDITCEREYSPKKAPRRSTRRRNLPLNYDYDSESEDIPASLRLSRRPASTESSETESLSEESEVEDIGIPATIFAAPITVCGIELWPTVAFDTFWRFAAERKSIDDKRRAGKPAPWTDNWILKKYFFCNTFRVLDKGCQFLIKEVIEKGSQDPEEVVFRVILFNLFTRIETWQLLDKELGPLTWATYKREKYRKVLADAASRHIPLYTPAFIKPAPHFGYDQNYANHLCFLEALMDNKLASKLLVAPSMADVYEYLYSFPSMGPFSTYQLMLCLSYTSVLNFHPNDFVMSGPGSISGLRKLFGKSWDAGKFNLTFQQEVMRYLVDSQDYHFERLALKFSGLGPKKLRMDIADIEHTLCEVDKYCRAAHPELKGKRTHITRLFQPAPNTPKHNAAVLPKAWKHSARYTPRMRAEKKLYMEKRYEIDSIQDHKDQDGVRKYHVYWVGYSPSDSSWEFESSLLNDAPRAVQDYLDKKGISQLEDAATCPY